MHLQQAPCVLRVAEHRPHAALRARTHPAVAAIGEGHAAAGDDVVDGVVGEAVESEAKGGDVTQGHVDVLAGDVAQEGHVGGGEGDAGLGGGGEGMGVYGVGGIVVPVVVLTGREGKVSWGRVEGEKGSQTYVTFVYACASGVSKAR